MSDNIFWNGTIIGRSINKNIQELCQEYWEAGFNIGNKQGISQRTQDILDIIDNTPLDPDSIYYKENLIKKIQALDKKEKN